MEKKNNIWLTRDIDGYSIFFGEKPLISGRIWITQIPWERPLRECYLLGCGICNDIESVLKIAPLPKGKKGIRKIKVKLQRCGHGKREG